MTVRADQLNDTRERIVHAAVKLHGKKGVAATSWAEIGKAARVSTATVYRHFPTFDSLIPACAQAAFAAGARLPSARDLAKQFEGLSTPGKRLERVITESCRCYERGEAWLDACRRETRSVPSLAAAARAQARALDALIAAASGSEVEPTSKGALKALLDFPFWKSLIDSGVRRSDAPAIITDLALRVVERSGR